MPKRQKSGAKSASRRKRTAEPKPTRSPVSDTTESKRSKTHGKRQIKWAKEYFDKLMEDGHITSSTDDVYELLLEKQGDKPIPARKTVANWLGKKKKNEVATSRIEGERYQEIERCSNASIGNDTEASGADEESCDDDAGSVVNDHSSKDALSLFNRLVSSGHVSSTPTEIHRLLSDQLDASHVPDKTTVRQWLKNFRARVGYRAANDLAWAKEIFEKLMTNGHLSSSSTDIHLTLQQKFGQQKNQGGNRMPNQRTVRTWLIKKREAVGYADALNAFGSRSSSVDVEDEGNADCESASTKNVPDEDEKENEITATLSVGTNIEANGVEEFDEENGSEIDDTSGSAGYHYRTNDPLFCFHKLIMRGHISSSATEIHRLLQKQLGTRHVPDKSAVEAWLAEERAHVGSTDPLEWAKGAFEELMRNGHISSSGNDIHLILQKKQGDNRVPNLRTVGSWLAKKRKAVGYVDSSKRKRSSTSSTCVNNEDSNSDSAQTAQESLIASADSAPEVILIDGIEETHSHSVVWNLYFHALQRFQHKHGHTFATTRQLKYFLASQRNKFWNGGLPKDRLEALNRIGFDWGTNAAVDD